MPSGQMGEHYLFLRMMQRIFLGLGSNCGECSRLMRDAVVLLEERGAVAVRKSSLYETEPVKGEWQEGGAGQNFLNAVVEVETDLSAEKLLDVCMEVERLLGRVRGERWGARTMDIDILIYGGVAIGWNGSTPRDSLREIVVPHPFMHLRNFVLVPFAEIAGEMVHPVLGLSLVELLRESSDAHRVSVSREGW